jgi:hypothetical protein
MNDFFNTNEVDDVGFKLPDGWYPSVIVSQNYGSNKKGTGMLLTLEFLVKDRVTVYKNFNLQHQNQVAANIGRSEFKRICLAVGIESIKKESDLRSLVGKKVAVKLGESENNSKFNDVFGFDSLENKGLAEPKDVPESSHINLDDVPF